MSAATAVSSYLGDEYEIRTVNLITEVLGQFDFLRYISANTIGGEDLYNFFLRNGMSRTVQVYCSLGHMYTSFCSHYLDEQLQVFISQEKPDIVLSVMPFFNGAIYRVTTLLHIPFAVITCDLNTANYVQDLYNPDSPLFRYCVPFNDPGVFEAIAPAKIPQDNLRVVGFPVRSSFFVAHDKHELRATWGFPQDKPVIMILMGAAGGRSSLGYLRKLMRVKLPLHVVVCVGRNELLKTCIENLELPPDMTVSVIGFTQQIAELMQASDVLITKPGPTSICEALYAQVPLLLDNTSQPIFWEQMNIDFVVEHGFGDVITSLRYVPLQVRKLLENPQEREELLASVQQFTLPDVRTNVRAVVEELLSLSQPVER